jgi:hypothetical protein
VSHDAIIENEYVILRFSTEKSILYVTLKEGAEINLERSISMQEASQKITADVNYAALIDARARTDVSQEARRLGADPARKGKMVAEAIVINSLAGRMLGNFFIRINKPHWPTKLFSTCEEAEVWLLQHLEGQIK